jgi:hypothetical protein
MLMVCCPSGLPTDRILRLLHPERIAPESPAGKKGDREAGMRDALRKKLRQSYPALAAKMPNPPSLEKFLAEAEKRLGSMPLPGGSAPSAADESAFAEDRVVELAKLLGIPDGPALDSYRYLVNGEGSPGSLALVEAERESSVRMD